MPDEPRSPRSGRTRRTVVALLLVYLVLLVVSHARRFVRAEPTPSASVLELQVVDGGRLLERTVRVAYREVAPAEPQAVSTLILLHGSPGSRHDFDGMLPALAARHRVIAVDLPGFGDSVRKIPDYSNRAHAGYVLELMDRLGIEQAHLLGFSMSGGVALRVWEQAPERVTSLTMLSAIGVQELELLGEYRLNHLIHGGQLFAIWLLHEATPHMGLLDRFPVSVAYARNFFDTDQRPLREILARFEPPLLILHGDDDFLVPPEAAREHHRLVPQSQLRIFEGSHFAVFSAPGPTARAVLEFLSLVDADQAPSREEAAPDRLARSAEPFDFATVPPFTGMALIVVIGLIALATLISEDLTCVVVGLMIAQGRLGFLAGVAGCFLGIFMGDMLLFLAGRLLGRPALSHRPLKWLIRPAQVEVASAWFRRRGWIVILLTRLMPGARLPTYFAAGLLHTRMLFFAGFFFLAVILWTPLLVGFSMVVGERALSHFDVFRRQAFVILLLFGLWVLLVVKLLVPLLTYRGRRRLVGAWRRWTRWEFWPPWIFYPPVVAYVLWLGLRHRGLLTFTAANPAIPAGGFISESKQRILDGLSGAPGLVAASRLIPQNDPPAGRAERARTVMRELGLTFPVVCKPDAGQRGSGVAVVRSPAQLSDYFERSSFDVVIQEYAPGEEFGLFYYRYPNEERGRIFSVTEKRMPVVEGDGEHSLERLILQDRRAVALAPYYFRALGARIAEVPAHGEPVQLVELGTHCRGAIFLDGCDVLTPELERRIDEISLGYAGFFFGRFDLRVAGIEELRSGRGFKIIELNGVTSEATHIYDPRLGVIGAWRTLFEQWRLAFEIGAANRDRGHPPARGRELLRQIREYRRTSRTHAACESAGSTAQ